MELNKIFASVLLAGIIAMASGFVADLLVSPQDPDVTQIQIDTEVTAADVDDEPEEITPIRPLLASADPSAGEGLTRACTSCHTFDEGGSDGVGPNLWGVVGAPLAHVDGFNYSSALENMAAEGTEWGFEELNEFIKRPRDYIPGTSMGYAGMRSPEDRADLIAFMNEMSDEPLDLPDPDELAEEEEEAAEDGNGDEPETDNDEDEGTEDNGDGDES